MRFTAFICFLLFSVFLSGQSSKDYSLTKAYGFDITFINNFLPLDNNIGFSSPYLFYIHEPTDSIRFKRKALGFNLNGQFLSEKEAERDLLDNDLGFTYRWGKGKTKNLFKKMNLLYGTDYLAKVDFITNQGVNNNGITSKRLDIGLGAGLGPFLALTYALTDRISLYTESIFYFEVSVTRSTFKVDDTNIVSEETSLLVDYRTNIRFPRTLVLFYKF